MKSNESDEDVQKTIDETISKIESETYSKVSYVGLKMLNEEI